MFHVLRAIVLWADAELDKKQHNEEYKKALRELIHALGAVLRFH